MSIQQFSSSPLKVRLTCLERWGYRSSSDYNLEWLKHVKDGGFNTVLVGGGSGFGPDSISPEMFVASETIPDLMPQSRRLYDKIIRERIALTRSVGLESWLICWGIPGPDESEGPYASTREWDRRIKYEMRALLTRKPELFGHREPKKLNWRGSRPLCISHPKVRTFYREIFQNLCRDYPEITGLVFFPGDHEPEICDHTCPRCSSKTGDKWKLYIDWLNEMTQVILENRPSMQIYVVVWGSGKADRILNDTHPACGVILTFNNVVKQERSTGMMSFGQPWMSIEQMGESTKSNALRAYTAGRKVIALHEFCQSEVYDPVHNFPLPGKTIRVLKTLQSTGHFYGVMDFWGDCAPIRPHANLIALAEYLDTPEESFSTLIQRVASRALGLPESQESLLVNRLVRLWDSIETAVDQQAFFAWHQRFSVAIGRAGARGCLYSPLIPKYLDLEPRSISPSFKRTFRNFLEKRQLSFFGKAQFKDRDRFYQLAQDSEDLCSVCRSKGYTYGANFLQQQALSLQIYGSLISSIGRNLCAMEAYIHRDKAALRKYILEEVKARMEQIKLTNQIGYGIHPELVEEDIQLMLYFLGLKDFPNTPLEVFGETTPSF